MRWLIVVGIVLLALLWFGIPALTSRSPFVAGSQRARLRARAPQRQGLRARSSRFLDLHETGAGADRRCWRSCSRWLRRDRVTLALAAGVVCWVIVEIAFALHGWPGLPRYMFEPPR